MKRLHHPFGAMLLAAWLLGCGPGVGGTGTGTGQAGEFLPDFQASAQPLCEAPFAAALSCGGGTSAPDGTLPVAFADRSGRIRVVFDGDGAALTAPCRALAFDGVWAVDGGGTARFYGGMADGGQPAREPAQLEVAAGAPGELRAVLRAAGGGALLGPVDLRPVALPLPPVSCP